MTAGEKSTVFICDPSVEAERITQALRAAEFHVVDVPLSMLVARVAVQRPRVVILDADADGALDAIARMRELPDAEGIDVLFCGRPGAALAGAEDALAHEGSGFFARPVNVPTLLKKIESLVIGQEEAAANVEPAEPAPRPVSQPPVMTQRSNPPGAAESRPSRPPSQPPPASRPPPSHPPSRPPASLRDVPGGPLSTRTATPSIVSRELAELLSRAEEIAADQAPTSDAPAQSPEDEIQAVLPEDVLAALDAPLEDDDEGEYEPEGQARVTTSGGRGATTGVRDPASHREASVVPDPLTNDGSALAHQTLGEPVMQTGGTTTPHRHRTRSSEPAPAMPAFGGHDPTVALTTPPRRSSSVPPPSSLHLHQPPSALSTTLGSELLIQQGGMISAPIAPFAQPNTLAQPPVQSIGNASMPLSPAPSTFEEPPSRNPPAGGPSARARSVSQSTGPYALGPGDAPRVLGQAIAARQTGALTFDTPTGVRRIVLREGDIVTAASGVDTESLLAFLGARGDLPRERVEALAGRLPPYGRHAGAALVAQGALGQEQLWPVLRAHAEYLMGQTLLVAGGTALLEPEPQGRLKTEPSVFGGAPGAEIFVDVLRRVVSNEDATQRCGGPASVVGEGSRAALVRECGLTGDEIDAVQSARGERLDAIAAAFPEGDMPSVLYALSLLGVVEMVRSVLERPPREAAGPDAIDEDAVRDRVRARIELVDEGDYFALLGVPHSATAYEVRRAYLDLRRAFEPSRLLTPGLIDLAEDVRRIASVLEEAYEILGDSARRERYRRAIDAAPREA